MKLVENDKNTRTPVEKVWGQEEWIVNNGKYCGKLLSVNKGWQCSIHYHPVKHETFLALVGCCWLEVWENLDKPPRRTLLRGWARDSVEIPPCTPHRFTADLEDALLVEFSTPHSEEDVVRVEESGPVEDFGGLYD